MTAQTTLIDKLLNFDYITEFIPIFIVLIAIDIAVALVRKNRQYQFGDTLANLSTGSISTIGANITKGLTIAVYVFVYNHFAMINMKNLSVGWRWIAGLILLFCVDCLYYWFHRFTHRCNFGWIGHSVHHQSEEYNLSVALRQGFFQPQMSWITFLPMAVVGFPAVWLVSVHAFMITYQFWIHTEVINKLGPLEYFLNTPSHHRVHHGVNKKLLDKNYAGVFIIWDKLFGTFEPEEFHPVYGTTTPLASWNPVRANLQHVFAVLEISKLTPSKWEKLKLWFMPPEWRPSRVESCHFPSDADLAQRKKYEIPVVPWQFIVAGIIFALGVGASMESIALAKDAPTGMAVFLGGLAFLFYLAASLIIERKRTS